MPGPGVEFYVYGYICNWEAYDYQCIYDNVSLIGDSLVADVNALMLSFGYKEVFKKRKHGIVLKNR